MSAKKTLLPQGKDQLAAGEELSPEGFSVTKPRDAGSHEPDGSVWSHLWFGLAMLALVLPLLIPGIPMNILVVVYVGLMGVVLAGCFIWNFLNGRPPKR